MKKLLPPLLFFCMLQLSAVAQTRLDSLERRTDRITTALKILREFRLLVYAQVQFQKADTAGAHSVAGGDFAPHQNNRFMIRRGRLRISFDHEGNKGFRIFQAVFQMDMTERGFMMRDFWGRIIDPWKGWVGIQAGLMDRPFGYELTTFDDRRETPERARMSQTIMPAEKDVGAELVIESPRNSPLAQLKNPLYIRVEGGAFNGTGGLASSFSSHKDFIGRLQLRDTVFTHFGCITISGGGSYYNGGVLQQSAVVYSMGTGTDGALRYLPTTDSAAMGNRYYKREYYGADMQLNIDYKIGTTILRGEFIAGTQPGVAGSNLTPTAMQTPPVDIYLRHFRGGYAYLVQTFKQRVKQHTIYHDVIFKFDSYNPNTQVAQRNLSTVNDAHTSIADVAYNTFGVGYIFRPYEFFQLQVYYDLVKNQSTGISNYTRDLKDNVLTIRVQFKFDTEWFNRQVKLL